MALFALYEATLFALLPIWGVRLGLSPDLAAATLSAVYIGSVVLQLPIGILSDKMARLTMLRVCGGAGLLGAVGIAALAAPTPALLGILAVWGGIVTAIYPVALSMAGDRFRGGELVTVNAAIIIAYGVGALVGPGLGGAAMDLWNPQGLPWFFVLLFAAFLVATTASGGADNNLARVAGEVEGAKRTRVRVIGSPRSICYVPICYVPTRSPSPSVLRTFDLSRSRGRGCVADLSRA